MQGDCEGTRPLVAVGEAKQFVAGESAVETFPTADSPATARHDTSGNAGCNSLLSWAVISLSPVLDSGPFVQGSSVPATPRGHALARMKPSA